MVRPRAFGPNEQTAGSNAFQQNSDMSPAEQQAHAVREFDAMTTALRVAGIEPIIFEDTDEPVKPDAIFPNNWISLHADGRVFLYPMESEMRRRERRMDIVEALSSEHGFLVREIADLSHLEDEGHFLEGTGSMVLDRINRIAYAALSSRTQMDALADFAQRADYEIAAFEARGDDGIPVYHTNVMMALGNRFAILCAEAIVDADKRCTIIDKLAATGRDVIEISCEQMHSFAGNMLELENASGEPVIVMSRSAQESLTSKQRDSICACGRPVSVDIPTIEHTGGGSVRCMLAEVFLPLQTGGRTA